MKKSEMNTDYESQFPPPPVKVEGQPFFIQGMEQSTESSSKPKKRLIERWVPLEAEDEIHKMITDFIISKGYDMADFKTWSAW